MCSGGSAGGQGAEESSSSGVGASPRYYTRLRLCPELSRLRLGMREVCSGGVLVVRELKRAVPVVSVLALGTTPDSDYVLSSLDSDCHLQA